MEIKNTFCLTPWFNLRTTLLPQGRFEAKITSSCLTPWTTGRLEYCRDFWTCMALDALIFPTEKQAIEPQRQTPLEFVREKFTAYVAGEFYRQEFDSKCRLWKVPRGRGPGYQGLKNTVTSEALLWCRTWRVLERLQSMGRLPSLPAFIGVTSFPAQALVPVWLLALVVEYEFLMQYLDCSLEGEPDGSRQILSRRQSQNRKLQDFSNPFRRQHTQLFIDCAITTAEQFDQFRKDFYIPMWKQRMRITADLIASKSRAFDIEGRLGRQGRKPMNKLQKT